VLVSDIVYVGEVEGEGEGVEGRPRAAEAEVWKGVIRVGSDDAVVTDAGAKGAK
jgi:hypothetical protein